MGHPHAFPHPSTWIWIRKRAVETQTGPPIRDASHSSPYRLPSNINTHTVVALKGDYVASLRNRNQLCAKGLGGLGRKLWMLCMYAARPGARSCSLCRRRYTRANSAKHYSPSRSSPRPASLAIKEQLLCWLHSIGNPRRKETHIVYTAE